MLLLSALHFCAKEEEEEEPQFEFLMIARGKSFAAAIDGFEKKKISGCLRNEWCVGRTFPSSSRTGKTSRKKHPQEFLYNIYSIKRFRNFAVKDYVRYTSR